MMNSDILKGSWKELRGRLKATWGDLTDDDLLQIEGDYDRLSGRLQKRYAMSREDAEKQIDRFIDRASATLDPDRLH